METPIESATITLKEALKEAIEVASSQEIRWLLEKATGQPYSRLLAISGPVLTAATYDIFIQCINRLKKGEPFAYVMGDVVFRNRSFDVNPGVLIPRPETELLVELAITHRQNKPNPRLLDLGTGSGILAITLALEMPESHIVAVDISAAAIETATQNAKKHRVNIDWRISDWFDQVPDCFDVIVSNPPYVAEGDPHLDALTFEPSLALASGPEGLNALTTVIKEAKTHLNVKGWLFCEHGYDQSSACRALFRENGYQNVESWFDAFGQARVTGGQIIADGF